MKTLFNEKRLVYLKATPSKGPDAAKKAPVLREASDPTHKAKKAMDRIARLTKTLDNLYKQEHASQKLKNKTRKIHEKLSKINDKLNNALSLNDQKQEKVIAKTLNELNKTMTSGKGELNNVRKIGIEEYVAKLRQNFSVEGNQNYQEAFEHMTGMFSLMNEGESVTIMGSSFTKKGTDLHLKLGKQKQTYSFYIVDGQWRIVNTTRKREVKRRRYEPQLAATELKNLPAVMPPAPTGPAPSKEAGRLLKKAAEGVPDIPKPVQKYVDGCKDGVKKSLHRMRFINPPNPFMRAFINAVDPKDPVKGIRKITALKNRLKEFNKKLDDSRNFSTAKKFKDNVVKKLVFIIADNTPNEDLAQRVSAKFPQNETGPLLASYKRMKKGPATATDIASTSGRAEKAPTAGKFKSLIRKGANKYIENPDAGNDFVLKGVTSKKIHQVLGTPKDKYVSITVTRKNGDKVKGAYLPDGQKTYTDADGKRVLIYNGDKVHINRVSTWKGSKITHSKGEAAAKKPKSDAERKRIREKLAETATKELKLNLTEMAIGEEHYVPLNQDQSLNFVKTSKDECTVQIGDEPGENAEKVTFKISNTTDIRNLAEHIVKFEGKLPKVAKRKKAPRRRRKVTRRPRATARKKPSNKESNVNDAEKAKKISDQANKVMDKVMNYTMSVRHINYGIPLKARLIAKSLWQIKLYGKINGKQKVIGVVTTDGRGSETKIRINYTPAYSKFTGKKGGVQLSYRNRNQVPAVLKDMFKKSPQKVPKNYVKVTKLNKKDIAT